MTKLIKKPVSIILTLMLLLSVVVLTPVSVSAETLESDFQFSNGTITGYSGPGGDVIIPPAIGGNSVTKIGVRAFLGCSNLEGVTIPDGVTSIGDFAFYNCTNLTSITIPDSITSIGSNMFYGCNNITDLTVKGDLADYNDLPWSVVKNLTITGTAVKPSAFTAFSALEKVTISDGVKSIGDCAFSGCRNLTSVTIGNSVESIGYNVFSQTGLTSIEIPDSVTSIGVAAFNMCSNLKSVTIGNGVTTISSSLFAGLSKLESVTLGNNVKTIDAGAFYNCTSLTSIDIPNGVTRIGASAFYGCSGLESVTIGNSVEKIEAVAFSNCSSLTGVTIASSETLIDSSAFNNCSDGLIIYGFDPSSAKDYAEQNGITFVALSSHSDYEYTLDENDLATITRYNGSDTEIMIPDSIDGYIVYAIGQGAFGGNTKLSNVKILNGTVIGSGAFSGCSALANVEIGSNVEHIYGGAFYSCVSLTEIIIPNSVKTLENGAFSGCSNLTEVKIGDGVTTIASGLFSGLSNLKSVTLGNNVTTIDAGAFFNCASLTSIDIPDCVTSIGSSAFSGCSGLTEVEIPDSVTSIGGNAFSGCSGLTEVEIPDSVTSIGTGAFSGCSNVTKLTVNGNGSFDNSNLPKSTVTDLTVTGMSIKPAAFFGLTALERVAISDSVTTIGLKAFQACTNLTSIDIPDSVTSIDFDAFYNCTSLTSIDIPDCVTSIGSFAFSGCSGLTEVEIPDSVTSLEAYVFANCKNLKRVDIPRTVTSINQWSFSDCPNLTICGYVDSAAEHYADSQSPAIPFSPILKINTGDGYKYAPLIATQFKESDDTSFMLSQKTFKNIELLGVQKKIDKGTHDMRFVAVVNEGIIKDADEHGDIADYGFVVAKTNYTSTSEATDNYVSKVTLGAKNTLSRSCMYTVNSYSGIYGRKDTNTKYKYMTLAVKDVPDDQGFVVRFYVKTKSGRVYYANHKNNCKGCVTSYSYLQSLIS
ncbi:MAG: leucine-rich repeat domain-containing protein [Ruminococcus sp.]|nr:leucine-rich repeat domain-containing protein [Ruminococcus sp.]